MSHANRGMILENDIERALNNGKCIVHKIPTEIKMTRGAGGRVVSAFPVAQSKFVDFIGIINNGELKAIAIEAKETKEKTRLDIKNIKEYQRDFLNLWETLGGNGYYVVRFTAHNESYLVPSRLLNDEIDRMLENNTKSVKYGWFVDNGLSLDPKCKDLYKVLTTL